MNVFVFGYFGWKNAGDDAIGAGLIKGINELKQNVKFYVPSKSEYFFENFKGPKIEELDFSEIDILKGVLLSDKIMIAGGTHFHDEGNAGFHRLKIFILFSLLITFSRILKKRVYLIGHGIGPLNSGWSRTLSRYIFSLSSDISVRDKTSKDVVDSLGKNFSSNLAFDSAVLLSNDDYFQSAITKTDKNILGISLLPFFEIYMDDAKKDKKIVENIASTLNSILSEFDDIEINLFSFRGGNLHSDTPILEKLNKKLSSERVNIVEYKGNIKSFLKMMSKCDYFLCMRYHSAIFSYMLDIPSLIILYMEKCESLREYVSFPERVSISLRELTETDIYPKFKKLIEEPNSHRAKLDQKKMGLRSQNMVREVLEKND